MVETGCPPVGRLCLQQCFGLRSPVWADSEVSSLRQQSPRPVAGLSPGQAQATLGTDATGVAATASQASTVRSDLPNRISELYTGDRAVPTGPARRAVRQT